MGTFFRTFLVHLIPSNRPNKIENNITVTSALCTSIPRRKDSSTHTVTMQQTVSHIHPTTIILENFCTLLDFNKFNKTTLPQHLPPAAVLSPHSFNILLLAQALLVLLNNKTLLPPTYQQNCTTTHLTTALYYHPLTNALYYHPLTNKTALPPTYQQNCATNGTVLPPT